MVSPEEKREFIKKNRGISLFTSIIVGMFVALTGYFIYNLLKLKGIEDLISIIKNPNLNGFFTSKITNSFIKNYLPGILANKFEAQGDIYGSFIFCSIGILVLTLSHTATLIFSKEKPCIEKTTTNIALGKLLKNKNLLKIIFITFLWRIAVYITTPFYGTYQIKGERTLLMVLKK